MSNEELLKPRYKVIADYPLSPMKVGDIFYNYGNGVMQLEKKGFTNIRDLDKYPHLFKKLEWWEDRKESEIKEIVPYIKSKSTGNIYEVSYYKIDSDANEGLALDVNTRWRVLTDMLPATKEEYENQVKGGKKQQ